MKDEWSWLMRKVDWGEKLIDEKIDWWESWLIRKSIDEKVDWWEGWMMRKLIDKKEDWWESS